MSIFNLGVAFLISSFCVETTQLYNETGTDGNVRRNNMGVIQLFVGTKKFVLACDKYKCSLL